MNSLQPTTTIKAPRKEALYAIGRIGKPHGVHGEVSFYFTDDVFSRANLPYLFLCIEGIFVPFFIQEYRFHGSETALVTFCDITTQEQARQLTGCQVYYPRQPKDANSDFFSWAELVDFKVFDASNNQPIGILTGVDDSTQNILFQIKSPQGNTLLVPANPDWITQVQPQNHTLHMQLPQGLLEL